MRINEIFYSLQGEGYFTGTPAVFIRFSGCNLRCPFCDTQHESFTEMTEAEIAEIAAGYPARHVVVTGGEPSLQLTASLVDKLHQAGKFVAVETNGTHTLPDTVDWITLSPKSGFVGTKAAQVVISRADELKQVYDGLAVTEPSGIEVAHHFLQPCDTGDAARNQLLMAEAVEFCKQHPKWRLSLQTHKITGIR